ncbi:MAG: endonuclease III [Candidatus Dadabacteria bacterium]|nr:endonuclease III [Candidatus Dadabacteria bacterium]
MKKAGTFKDSDISKVIGVLKKRSTEWNPPVMSLVSVHGGDPFRILVSTILSLRTRDKVTAEASKRLFAEARTPSAILGLGKKRLERLIYPVGFYRTKAGNIIKLCRRLETETGGKVPDTIEGLLSFEGVGRKTANLVVTLGYDKPGICVDIHVHRISNRLGYVCTKTPEKTEFALREKLPRRYWKEYNGLMVAFGQTICRPVRPLCDVCPVSKWCMRVGV